MTSEFAIAIHALAYLNRRGCTLHSEELAENVCTNPATIRRVLSKLKKAGLVETREGADGGYTFRLPPEQVTLSQVSQALGVEFVRSGWKSGDVDRGCMVCSGMGAVMDRIYGQLDEACRRRLAGLTLLDVDQMLLEHKNSLDHQEPV